MVTPDKDHHQPPWTKAAVYDIHNLKRSDIVYGLVIFNYKCSALIINYYSITVIVTLYTFEK